MITIDQAFTGIYGSRINYYPIVVTSVKFTDKEYLEINYNYISPLRGNGVVICNYKDGFYNGKFNETIDSIKYNGKVCYIFSTIGNILYFHGEWETGNIDEKGYDFFVGTKIS